jgi:hypothetical protein
VIRFRHTEDERRYLALRSEIYVRIAQHLPAEMVSEVLCNFGKLEQLLHLEGVRQGLAVAEMSSLAHQAGESGVRHLKAFQAHAMMYGSQDTPLTAVEQERLERWGLPADSGSKGWLDGNPLRYAPQTVAEWESEQAGGTHVPPSFVKARQKVEQVVAGMADQLTPKEKALLHGEPSAPRWAEGAEEDVWSDEDVVALLGDAPAREGNLDTQERPAALDLLRDEIMAMRSKGWEPKTWEDLIMQLHVATKQDAAFLDIQLSTQVGRAVLDQCGVHIYPGAGLFLAEIQSEADRLTKATASASPVQEAGGQGGSADDSGTSPGGEPPGAPGDAA